MSIGIWNLIIERKKYLKKVRYMEVLYSLNLKTLYFGSPQFCLVGYV